MRNLKKSLAVIMVLAMMILPVSVENVFAAAGVTISSPDTVKAGESFTVRVKYNADSLARLSGKMTYDPEVIEYVSGGSSTGNGGVVQLKGQSDNGTDVVFELQFKALYKGSDTLKVKTKEMYDMDEQLISGASPSTSTGITVREKGQSGGDEEQTDEEKDKDEEVDQSDDKIDGDDVEQDKNDGDDEAIAADQDSGIPGYVYFIIAAALVVLIIIAAAAISKNKRKKHKH